MARYQFADDNLYSHIRTLRMIVIALLSLQAATIAGWYATSGVQRLSLPPQLEYAQQIVAGNVHPWEVYNFTGYVWQLLNRCETDCVEDLPARQRRMISFLTPQFAGWLERDHAQRRNELSGRTRYLLPTENPWQVEYARELETGTWIVRLDVLLVEHIGSAEVKRTAVAIHNPGAGTAHRSGIQPVGALFGQNSSTCRTAAEVMTYLLLTVIGALVTAAAAPAFATERVEWKGDPIQIRLSTGFERRVIVQGATGISIGLPDTATQYLHVQSIGDSFWLTANAPIDSPARIILKIHPDGTTVVAEVRSISDIPPPGNLFIAIPRGSAHS